MNNLSDEEVKAVQYREPSAAKPQVVANFRIDARDLARLILYWRKRRVEFHSRSELIRVTFETFLIQNKCPEIDSLRAGEILSDEIYRKVKRQEAIGTIVAKADNRMMLRLSEKLKTTEEQTLEEMLARAPEEVETEEVETEEGD